jgi:hypothetical protein
VRFVGVTKPPKCVCARAPAITGALTLSPPHSLCIVLEFVARGSLYDLLQSDDPLSGEVMLVILKGEIHSLCVMSLDAECDVV